MIAIQLLIRVMCTLNSNQQFEANIVTHLDQLYIFLLNKSAAAETDLAVREQGKITTI